MLQLKCDRCGKTSDGPPIYGMEPHSQSGLSEWPPAFVEVPDDWMRIEDKHLYSSCRDDVRRLISQPPERKHWS